MKITHPLLTKSLGLFGATVIRALTSTLDYRILYYDPLVDPVHPHHRRRGIYVLWHEYLIFPLGVRGKGMTVLISQHRDGELITQVMRHLGFQSVRGSSTRGGVPALRRMLQRGMKERGMKNQIRTGVSSFIPHPSSLIVTPDGPRGPRRHLAEGAIFLASRLQMPIVCMGFAFDRPWRQNSWDHFAIPRPFSRARAVISPFIEIPTDLDRDRIEHHRLEVEQILNQVTGEAETWAESGKRKAGEMPMLRHQPAPQMTRSAA
jgi:lysophospholipid acyltransferase (LPLAT)-like uncharacterized protein